LLGTEHENSENLALFYVVPCFGYEDKTRGEERKGVIGLSSKINLSTSITIKKVSLRVFN